MANREFVVVDIETTGLSPYVDKIVEIGVVKANIDNSSKEILIDKIVRENGFCDLHKDSWVFKNTDLTFSEVINGEPFETLVPELNEIFGKWPSTAFNRDFDFGFLVLRGINIRYPLPCPMKLSTNIVKLPKRGKRGGFKWPKFQEAWDYFFRGVPYEESHRAIDDAIHEADLIRKMFQQGCYTFEVVAT